MPNIHESFKIKGTEKVVFRIDVGNGMIGGFQSLLDGKEPKIISQNNSHIEYDLGPGEDLKYCGLVSTVLVQDVNPMTNQTVVTVKITQGTKVVRYSEDQTTSDGGTVYYGISMFFE